MYPRSNIKGQNKGQAKIDFEIRHFSIDLGPKNRRKQKKSTLFSVDFLVDDTRLELLTKC